MTAPRRIMVIGLGNPDRGDDGIGPAVVAALEGRLPRSVKLLARRGDMLALLGDWADVDALVCIDAAASMGQPGRVNRLDLEEDALPLEAALASSHGFGLAEAVKLARTLGLAPAEIIVFAIEGDSFDGGGAMTSSVAGAIGDVADRVVAEVDRMRHSREAAHA